VELASSLAVGMDVDDLPTLWAAAGERVPEAVWLRGWNRQQRFGHPASFRVTYWAVVFYTTSMYIVQATMWQTSFVSEI
jgi:hypothetical protein